jgi:hypothetical protein
MALTVAVPLVFIGALTIPFACSRPPKDDDLIRRFEANRAAFERVRDLLISEADLRDVGPAGMRMANSLLWVLPPSSSVSTARYGEYMHLLKLIGSTRASRSEGLHPDICIGVWAAGFAGDTKHKNICWVNGPRDSHGRFTSKVIESKWYLEED